jgi:mono/diheme cytochrome c family protein
VRYLAILYIMLGLSAYYFYQHIPRMVEVAVPVGVDERLWRRGRAMYNSRCTTCHNVDPNVPGSVGPKLRGVSEELLRDRLSNGKNGMPIQKDMLRFVKAFQEYLK